MNSFAQWRSSSFACRNCNKNMILIGMSAMITKENMKKAFNAGMHFYASKPVKLSTIEILIGILGKEINLRHILSTITDKVSQSKVNLISRNLLEE